VRCYLTPHAWKIWEKKYLLVFGIGSSLVGVFGNFDVAGLITLGTGDTIDGVAIDFDHDYLSAFTLRTDFSHNFTPL